MEKNRAAVTAAHPLSTVAHPTSAHTLETCGDDDDAGYTLFVSANPTSGYAPLTVSFAGIQTPGDDPYDYSWDFGDGGSSSLQDPVHTYSSGGVFQVVLTTTDPDGTDPPCTAYAVVSVTSVTGAGNLTVAAEASPTQGNSPLLVGLFANVQGGAPPYSYSWNLGNGGTSTEANPVVTYTSTTNQTFTATVSVRDSGGATATSSVAIDIENTGSNASFVAAATATPLNGAAPLVVSFAGGANGGTLPYIWSWVFGDGETSNEESPAHEYTSPGNYTAVLTVTDQAVLTAQSQVSITISPAGSKGLSAETTAFDDTTGAALSCGGGPVQVGDTVSFTVSASGGSGNYTYAWAFTDGGTGTGSTVSHVFGASGGVSVTATATDTATGATGTAICNLAITSQSLTVSVTATDTKTGTMVDCTGGTPVGVGDVIAFTASASGDSGVYSYDWTFGDGAGTGSGANPSYAYGGPGTFSAEVIVTDQVTKDTTPPGGPSICTVTVQATPALAIAPTFTDTTAGILVECGGTVGAGDLVTFASNPTGGSGTYSVSWTFGDGSLGSTSDPVIHAYQVSGSVNPSVTVTDSAGANASWGGSSCTLTVQGATSHHVAISISPSSCGPLTFGSQSYSDGDTATMENGSQPVVAPDCQGYEFQAWSASGSVSITGPGPEAAFSEVQVTGDGGLTLNYENETPVAWNPCGETQQPFVCVASLYKGYFLNGISVENTIGVWAMSHGQLPTSVSGDIDGQPGIGFGSPEEDGGPFTDEIDMGSIAPGDHTLRATATFPDGSTQSGSITFTVLTTPAWMTSLVSAGKLTSGTGTGASEWGTFYTLSLDVEFNFLAEFPGEVPASIPFIGGKVLGLVPAVGAKWDFNSAGELSMGASVGVSREVEIWGQTVGIGVKLVAQGNYNVGGGTIQWVSSQLGISVNGEVVIDIPNPWGVDFPGIGNVGIFPEIRASPAFQVTPVFAPAPGDSYSPLSIQSVQGKADFDAALGASVQLTKYLQLTLGGDTAISITYDTAPTVPVTGTVSASICIWATLILVKFKVCPVGGSYPIGYGEVPQGRASSGSALRHASGLTFSWEPRYYNTSSYDQLQWHPGNTAGTAVGDIFPLTQISAAGDARGVYLAYTTDHVNQNEQSSLGFEGYTLNPVTGTLSVLPPPPNPSSQTQLFDPVIALESNGSVAALWSTMPDGALGAPAPINTTLGLERGTYVPSSGRWNGIASVNLTANPIAIVADSCGGVPHAAVLTSSSLLPSAQEDIVELDLTNGSTLHTFAISGFSNIRVFSCTADTLVLSNQAGAMSLFNLANGTFLSLPSLSGYRMETMILVPGSYAHLLGVFAAPRGCLLADYNLTRGIFLGQTAIACQVRNLEGAHSGSTDFALVANATGLEVVAFRHGHVTPYGIEEQNGLQAIGIIPLGANDLETWGIVNYGNASNPLLNLTLGQVPLVELALPALSATSLDVGDTLTITSQLTGAMGPVTYAWAGLPAGCPSTSSPTLTCKPTQWGRYNATISALLPGGTTIQATSPPFLVAPDPSLSGIDVTPSVLRPGGMSNISAAAAGGLPPYRLVWSLPTGCLTIQTHAICKLNSPGTYLVGLTLYDRTGRSANASAKLLIESLTSAKKSSAIFGFQLWEVYGMVAAVIAVAVAVVVYPYARRRKRRPMGPSPSAAAVSTPTSPQESPPIVGVSPLATATSPTVAPSPPGSPYQVTAPSPSQTATPLFCSSCGAPSSKGLRFCTKCGVALDLTE